MTQAPNRDLALDALLARLERICKDPWIPHYERVVLALTMANSSSSLVLQAWTIVKTHRNGKLLPEEQRPETLMLRLPDETMHAIPFTLQR